jgi:peroxiredoxin
MRLTVGATVAARELVTADGDPVAVPDPGTLVHLQFRRFAGCPVCNLHLRSFAHCHDELRAAGVDEVVVFHAPADDLRRYTADLPFAVIPDPGKALYREFGVEASRRALLDPRAYATIARSIAHTLWEVLRLARQAAPRVTPSAAGGPAQAGNGTG